MKNQPETKPETPTSPNFLGFMLDRDAFLVGTLDAQNLAAGVSPLKGLQVVSSEWTPPEKTGPDLTLLVPHSDLAQYVNSLADALRSYVKGHGDIEVDCAELKTLYDRYLAHHLGLYEAHLSGCYLARSSLDWSEIEAEGQYARFHEVAYEMLKQGFVPKFAIADGMTGTQMVRPGILRLIARAMHGQIDGLFLHTLDRFSRAELDGLLSFVLVHRLIGNVVYKPTIVDVFVRFEPEIRQSMLLAGQEIMKGAVDGARIRGLLERGKIGRLRRLKSYHVSFGRRLFHEGVHDGQ